MPAHLGHTVDEGLQDHGDPRVPHCVAAGVRGRQVEQHLRAGEWAVSSLQTAENVVGAGQSCHVPCGEPGVRHMGGQ